MGGRTNKTVVAAVVAALLAPPLLALAVVGVLGASDARRDVDEAEAGPGEAVLIRATTLATRLADECDWWRLQLLGIAEAVEATPAVDAGSPQRTDQAIADLRTVLDERAASTSDTGLAQLAAAVDGLNGLAEVRGDAEAALAAPGGGTLDSGAAAQVVTDAYDRHIAAVFDASDALILDTVDGADAQARAGVQLTASRQLHLTRELGRGLLLATAGGGADTPEEVAALAERQGEWVAGLAELSTAPAPYGALVAQHLPADVTAPLAERSDEVLRQGATDVPLLLADVDVAVAGLDDLGAALEVRGADEARETADAARDRERRSLLLAGAAVVGLLVLAGVVVALLVRARSRPTSGPPSTPSPGVQPPDRPPLVPDRG